MQKENTKAISDQNNSYYFANFKDNLDLAQSSRFTQGYVAAEIMTLTMQENDYLREMIDAQSKNIGSSIAAGFGTAVASIVEGAAESAGGVGTAGAGVYQAKESVNNAAKISKLQGDTDTALKKYKEQKDLIGGKINGNNPAETNAAQQPGTVEMT